MEPEETTLFTKTEKLIMACTVIVVCAIVYLASSAPPQTHYPLPQSYGTETIVPEIINLKQHMPPKVTFIWNWIVTITKWICIFILCVSGAYVFFVLIDLIKRWITLRLQLFTTFGTLSFRNNKIIL